MTATLPYGTWPSPLTAQEVSAASPRIDAARFVGDEVWWSESLPSEGGRTAVLRGDGEADPVAVLPAPWSARSRVHEYGGGAWAVTDAGLVFVEHSDQRIRLIERPGAEQPGAEPQPLTPDAAGMRFGDLTWHGGSLLAVRETHTAGAAPERDIVAVPLDGSAADDAGALRVLASGHRFVAYPRLSPSGDRLAFIAWEHPDMPWDATTLRVRDLATGDERVLAGGPGVSVLQPEWTGADELTFSTDAGGRWQLVRQGITASTGAQLTTDDADTGGPLWNLGARWYLPLGERVAAVRTHGRDALIVIEDGAERPLPLALSAQVLLRDAVGSRILVTGGGEATPTGLWLIDVDDPGAARAIRGGTLARDAAWYPRAQELSVAGPTGPVHAFAYPPTNPGVTGPDGEAPPYIVTVHGGPTAHVAGEASSVVAYFTSRGIGVLDVNYGGSSGYGRAYRDRLAGAWGVVDVDDVAAAASGLVEQGLADPRRIAIKGSSAGGWTVLAALTRTDVFAAGISRYGVADLRALAADTHDFESRYLDGLVGPLPQAEQTYIERSPLTRIDRLRVPVLLLQGADDPVVPPAQAEAMRDALAGRSIPHALVVFEGEAHGFRRAATIVGALESELSFLGQVFGFDTPGIPTLQLAR
ncbi:prolyl oligopeptidase family serine peptidase [Microbacterium sp. LRZ72]|uniref:S9 family peptidase n=1 Tax=Microbacterium sp. LRZ72 TaxID=2942481 RepID=UPI0029B7EE2A|nr:prolyl oligopeptidase family serine peptidase [Microbacterium sp. LRZ72]MDX2375717.1 prolyl oligopeptidase family serine peptidase [Microbacterium sp. LRZ72]